MSNMQGIKNAQEIMDLVRLLRQNGDKVLSASSKLSLSTTLLHNLNESFSLIVDDAEDLDSSFQVCNSSKIDIFRDIKFLYDFVQKTIGLKVTHRTVDPKVCIDITKFRHLKYLELKKVCIMLVKGLQAVRGQLESVICAGRKGVCTVSELLAKCGGDIGAAFVWCSLKHLALPHNALESLDRSLELAPWLQILDLSHNLITSAVELDCLPNLKYVNLGYNKLESVPTFNKAALHSLQVLILKNNYIENINALEGFESIIELDLSFNCLTDHSVLWVLKRMCALLWISLEGNPLSHHPKHRLLCVKHLHPSLSDSKFVLDHLQLTRSEKVLVSENRVSMIRAIQSTSREDIPSLMSSLNSTNTSIEVFLQKEEMASSQSQEFINSLEKSITRSRKRRNVKEAVIADDEMGKEENRETSDRHLSPHLETSRDHLETKKKILALREKFGENNWLSSHAGTFVQDIMGIQPTSSSILSTTPTVKNFIDTTVMLPTGENRIYAAENPDTLTEGEQLDSTDDKNEASAVESITVDVEEEISDQPSNKNTETVPYTAVTYDPEEEKGDLYLVQKNKNGEEMEELFLIITVDSIIERNALSGEIKYSWSLNSVLSCVMGRSEPVTIDIIFDTARKDRQNRRYFLDLDDAKKIVATIGEKMRTRPLLLKVFKCMKCSTHFSHDSEYTTVNVLSTTGSKQLKCPTCKSTLVIQTDELSATEKEASTKEEQSEGQILKDRASKPMKSNLQHSNSNSSIGGTEGGAIISVTTSLLHFDSHPQAQVCCSATSLEESRESTPSASALAKKYESDIEILSNPSQSSIEVLDENSKSNLTPNRKRSSEERHVSLPSTQLTASDTVSTMPGLTESSSSGSLTDSVCTAYENKSSKQISGDDKSLSGNNTETEPLFAPVNNLTSMLGGLLQSMKIGNNKTSLVKQDEDTNFFSSDVQYSFTDFSSVDHRIKLHIILNIFEQENEELVLLLRANILMHSVGEIFPGCLVLSTSKVYILRIGGFEGEDPQRWLLKEFSWTMDRLRSFSPLPFKQGIVVELQQPAKPDEESFRLTVICILQDFQRTSNFLFYLTDLPLPDNCEVEFSVPQHCTTLMHNLLKNAKYNQEGDSVRLLALFSSAISKHKNLKTKLKDSALIVTASTLLILEDDLRWLISGNQKKPIISKEQAMTNLIAVEHCDTSLTFNFLDEIAGVEEYWCLEFNSVGAVEAVINSIQPPWEELFSVPLQVTTKIIAQ